VKTREYPRREEGRRCQCYERRNTDEELNLEEMETSLTLSGVGEVTRGEEEETMSGTSVVVSVNRCTCLSG
jgi:hypothetical protein